MASCFESHAECYPSDANATNPMRGKRQEGKRRPVKSFAQTTSDTLTETSISTCQKCGGSHHIRDCNVFHDLEPVKRGSFEGKEPLLLLLHPWPSEIEMQEAREVWEGWLQTRSSPSSARRASHLSGQNDNCFSYHRNSMSGGSQRSEVCRINSR